MVMIWMCINWYLANLVSGYTLTWMVSRSIIYPTNEKKIIITSGWELISYVVRFGGQLKSKFIIY